MRSEILDDFHDLSAWMPVASGLAELRISREGAPFGDAMRLDFDFKGGGGFVVARRTFSLPMSDRYAIGFQIHGDAPTNRLELKLADASGRNVWWRHWDAFDFPREWQRMRVLSREIEYAWGPAGGGAITELGAVELVIAAKMGGAGTVWIGDLTLEDMSYSEMPRVSATSAQAGHPPAFAIDGDVATSWLSEPIGGGQQLDIDFTVEREYGGLVIHWASGAEPSRLRVDASNDGSTWTTVHAAEPGGIATSFLYLPGTSRFLRLDLEPGPSGVCGIAELDVKPFEFTRSIEAFFEEVARAAPRGHHPRWLSGEQSYWTPIGISDGRTCAIMNEEGAVEIDRGTFSVEPFVHTGDRLLTWADGETSLALEEDWIPVPSSIRRHGDLTVRTTAFAGRAFGLAVLYLRYRVTSTATAARSVKLFAAIRPFQVNPPWQRFGSLGGMSRTAAIAWDGRVVRVDGRCVVPLGGASDFGAAPFERGEVTVYLARGALPSGRAVTDEFARAAGALSFDLDLEPGVSRDVYLALPFDEAEPGVAAPLAGADGASELDAAIRGWRDRLGGVAIAVPKGARDCALTARTAAAQILVNRDGPALQPGPRRYTRSWIRDGAIMAAALLRSGRTAEPEEFVRWYATHQREDGNVPCCVDRSGPDWLPEHDSHGELIYAVMECYRFTRDRGLLVDLWPAVRKAVDYLEGLRRQRLGPEYERDPELRARYGLLPESVSHEGYLAQPVHAYWDDFWALQGYRDAAAMAAILGEESESRRIAEIGDAFRAALRESIAETIRSREIPYVPGSVEWADFDPTATANTVALLGFGGDLPVRELAYTFDEYIAPGYGDVTEVVSTRELWDRWREGGAAAAVDSRAFLKADRKSVV